VSVGSTALSADGIGDVSNGAQRERNIGKLLTSEHQNLTRTFPSEAEGESSRSEKVETGSQHSPVSESILPSPPEGKAGGGTLASNLTRAEFSLPSPARALHPLPGDI